MYQDLKLLHKNWGDIQTLLCFFLYRTLGFLLILHAEYIFFLIYDYQRVFCFLFVGLAWFWILV